ncbi:uncharacterized protein LOC124198884 [Daphnia pulex]|uniref:uncharacterized protein LOC124198884 n=1 Tax=Daphnia pulex TaxID=6669 RepID=UPI001EE07F24|nr:uncharacterized protein LOC124198884 [Daphnia pulex]
MGTRTPVLLRSHWIINNQLTLPLVAVDDKGKTAIRGLIQLLVPVTIFLDTIFADTAGYTTRGFGDDQYQIYKSMEGILQATGIDGKACLLRTICEMQTNPIGEFTVVGEILTILLSPKRGINDFLHDYIDAEHIGQSHNMTCAGEFRECPVSLYNLFRSDGDSNEIVDDEDDEDESEQSDVHEESAGPHSTNKSHEVFVHPNLDPLDGQNLVENERPYNNINTNEH